eukprot:5288849-Pleurochrysis_carterae.AAC.1
MRLHVLPQDSRALGRRHFLDSAALVRLEHARDLHMAVRAAGWRHVDRQTLELGEGADVGGAVRAEKVAALRTITSGSVEPLQLLELAQKAAA